MKNRSSLLVSAVVGAVLFTIGYFIVVVIPGGGTVTEQEFTSFYANDDQFFNTLLLLFALLAGCWAMVWFFTELRSRLPDTVLSRVAYVASLFGLGAVAVGAAILFAPIGVQMNSDAGFVGYPIAHAFAQAGLGTMLLVGMYTLAFSVGLNSIAMRRAGLVPGWVSIAGIVIAVLMAGSFVWAPGLLFPIWVLALGIVGRLEGRHAPVGKPATV